MLEVIIELLKNRVRELYPQSAIHGLCTLQRKDGNENTMWPAEYCKNGESKAIDWDFKKGQIYFRLTNDITIEENNDLDDSCQPYQVRRYPLRMVVYLPKKIYGTDDSYIDTKVGENIARVVQVSNDKLLRQALKVDNLESRATRIIVNPDTVWGEETRDIANEANSKYVLVAIDFDFIIGAELSCFDYWACGDEVTIITDTITRYIECVGNLCKVGQDPITYDQVKALIDGGAWLTCDDLENCQIIIDIQESIASAESDITDLFNGLAAESSTRAAADTTLQNNINAEATTRANADTTLQSNINAEAATRAADDASVLSQAEAYADSVVTGLWKDNGSYDASGNTWPTAADTNPASANVKKGFIWTISVQGTLSGTVVHIGDTVRALVNNPGQTASNWAIGEGGLGYVPENSANKTDAMAGNTGSSTKYLSVKGVYDWVISLGYITA